MEPRPTASSTPFPPVIIQAAPSSTPAASPTRQLVAAILSICLAAFLIDGILSLADSCLSLFFNVHVLSSFRALAGWLSVITALVTYVLMGITPMVPKRVFLPVTLFNPVGVLVFIPLMIFYYRWMGRIDCVVSAAQVALGLAALCWIQGGFKWHFPPVTAARLGKRGFSGWNLSVFLLVNVIVLPLAVAFYLAFCAATAINHFSAGFLALRSNGLIVQARRYVRDDGKAVILYPMSHVADADFYRRISGAMPTNSIVLIEGVSDKQHLLTNGISYKRMAKSLGLSEQHEKFDPGRGRVLRADVDVEEFAPTTIGFLNLVMLVHTKGLNAPTLLMLMQYSPPPDVLEQLFTDLLRKRNRHLLNEMNSHLTESDIIVIPWGVAHMPELARELEKAGFHLKDAQDYVTIRFRSRAKTSSDTGPGGGKPL
jgi:hypothetical protein